MSNDLSVAAILGNTVDHYELDKRPGKTARKGQKQPEQQKAGIGSHPPVSAQKNDSRAENPQFRDNLGRIVEIRPHKVLGETRYGPRRLQNGEWVHVPTGGNVPAQLSRDRAVELFIKHAEFMGWERVEVQS